MKTKNMILILLVSTVLKATSQEYVVYTKCMKDKYLRTVQHYKNIGLRSAETFNHDMFDGKVFSSKTPQALANYGKSGLLLEEHFMNGKTTTDSIRVYTYDGMMPKEIKTFKTNGALLAKITVTYNQEGLIASLSEYKGEKYIQYITSYVYSGDTIKKYVLKKGTSIEKKEICITKSEGSCDVRLMEYLAFDNKDSLICKSVTEYKNGLETSNVSFPDKYEIKTIPDGYGFPLETRKLWPDGKYEYTIINKYNDKNLCIGSARYKGNMILEEGNTDFDIIKQDQVANNVHLLYLTKYVYKYY